MKIRSSESVDGTIKSKSHQRAMAKKEPLKLPWLKKNKKKNAMADSAKAVFLCLTMGMLFQDEDS